MALHNRLNCSKVMQVINSSSWATIGGAYSDYVLDVAEDPKTEELYAVGRAYDYNTSCNDINTDCRQGTWPNEPPANNIGQIVLAKLNANLTIAWVKLQGPSATFSYGSAVTFNSVCDTAIITGQTYASIEGQTFNGGLQDAFVSAYLSNGTRKWTKLSGTAGDDVGYDIVSYQSGAIHAGKWQSGNAFIEYRFVNGSIGWQTLQITSTCSAIYESLQYNPNDVYVYVFGNGKCIVDGSLTPTYNFFVTRHFVADGTRDTSFSIMVKNDVDNDYVYAGIMDPVTQRIAIGGNTGSQFAEYATVKMDGSLIQSGVDRLKSNGQVRGMAVTNKSVIAFTGWYGSTAFIGIDNATFAWPTSQQSTSSVTTVTSIGSTSTTGTATFSASSTRALSTPTNIAAVSSSVPSFLTASLTSKTSSDQGFEQLSYINIYGKSYPKTIAASSAQSLPRNNDVTVAEQLPTLTIIIFIGSIVLILTLCAGIAIWRCQTSNKRQRANIVLSQTSRDGTTEIQDASRTQSNMGGTDMTAIVTNHDYGTDFKKEIQIASGSQGTVCMIHVYTGSELGKRAKGTALVGKFSNVPVKMLSVRMRDAFLQEVSLHWMLRDTPGFARVCGYAEQPVATILMEFYPLGSLQPFIEAKRGNGAVGKFVYSKRQMISLLRDCTSAFHVMHMKGVVHCDIKSANVLLKLSLNYKLQAMITDFGVARLLSSRKVMVSEFKESRLNGLSLSWAAPEAIARLRTGNALKEVNPQVWIAGDVFSTAMMLKEMLTRKGPWDV